MAGNRKKLPEPRAAAAGRAEQEGAWPAMSSMEYELVGQSLIVRLSGELDLVAAARFKETVEDIMDRRPVRRADSRRARSCCRRDARSSGSRWPP